MPPWERMNWSASRSSSPVVTPGRTCSRRRSSVRATTAPASAICSISGPDFRMIIPAPAPAKPAPPPSVSPRRAYGSRRRLRLLDRLLDLGEDLLDLPVAVDADEDAPGPVVLHQRLRVVAVEGEAGGGAPPRGVPGPPQP